MAAALFLLFWAIYRYTATWSFSSDGLCYMLDVEFGGPRNLLHPFHMVYSLSGRIIYMAAQFSGYHGRAIFLMQAVDALVGAAAIAVFYKAVRSRFEVWPSTIAALALGCSFAFWSEIVDPGCYALAALATCALLSVLIKGPGRSPFLVGLAHGLAILGHFMLVLVIPAFVWSLFKATPSFRNSLARYLLGVLIFPVLAYGYMAFHLGSVREFYAWFLEPAWKPQSDFLTQNYLHWNPIENVRVSALAFRDSWMKIPLFWPAGATLLSSVVVTVLLVGVIWGSAKLPREKTKPALISTLWIWIIGLNGLQFVYATDTRFRILWLPVFMWLLLEVGEIPSWRRGWKWTAALLPLLVWVNFLGTIRPRSRPENNPSFLRTIWLTHHLTPTHFLLFRGKEPESIRNFYAAYFAHEVPARSIQGFYFSHPEGGLQPLNALLTEQEKLGRRIVFESSLWDAEEQRQIAETSHVTVETISRWMAQWRPVARLVAPDGYALVEVARQAK